MKKLLTLILLSFTLILSSCTTTIPNDNSLKYLNDVSMEIKEQEKNNSRKKIKEGDFLNKLETFSSKLNYVVYEDYYEEENMVVSPLSVFFAFAMEYETLEDDDKISLLNFLNMTDSDLFLVKHLINSLLPVGKDDTYNLKISNTIWTNSDLNYDYKKDILNTLSTKHYCGVIEAPFTSDNIGANKELREFIKKMTDGLIDEDFDISNDMTFLLMNTLYFKDVWGNNELSTRKEVFKDILGSETELDFNVGYYHMGKLQREEKYEYTYISTMSDYKLTFIRPKDGFEIKDIYSVDLIKEVNSHKYLYTDSATRTDYHSRCIFPTFKVESSYNLVETLLKHYDFDNLFINYHSKLIDEDMFISDVIHKVVYSADKKGTEGAAVTIIGNKATSVGPINKQVYEELILDKPFAFVLSSPDGVVLFSGIINILN